MALYTGSFSSRLEIEKEYNIQLDPDIEILVAWYGVGNYEGESFVLFRQNGKLFEVNASHCSCYGLEDKWEPEETSVAALILRFKPGGQFAYAGDEERIQFSQEMRHVIAMLKQDGY